MNLLGLIGTLRKFGNFLVGLFPVLGHIYDFFVHQLKRIAQIPAVQDRWSDFAETDRGKAIIKVFQRFFWRDYSGDRLDLNELPPDTVSSLRIIFILSILLCLLIPLAVAGNFPEVSLTMLSGETGKAPIWSVALWIISAAVAWGAVMAGASLSNRPLTVCMAIFYISIFGMVALFSGRLPYNALLPLGAYVTLFLQEKSLQRGGIFDWKKFDVYKGLLSGLIIGVPAGVYLLALTPLHAFNFGNVLATGSVFGGILGILVCFAGRYAAANAERKIDQMAQTGELSEAELNDSGDLVSYNKSDVSKRVWLLTAINLAFLTCLLVKSGWEEFAGQLLSTTSLWNGYLWPVWYFIGIGIIFKLLKHSKVFSRGVIDSLPSVLFIPVVLMLIIGGLVVTWSESIVSTVSLATATGLEAKIAEPFYHIYRWSNSWLWHSPEWNQTALIMRWVFGLEFLAIIWLLIKRRLKAEHFASLFYFIVLSTFLVYEYNFQQFSFNRTPTHSFVLLGFFSLWLLWLFHRVGLKMSLESSPLWPSAGRLPIYGGVLLWCLGELHARSALEDFNIMNKIFLVMFRGIIDVGIPYFLYVFATRRFKELPLKLSTIFGIFCAGAVLTFPLNVVDKLAMCGWSLPAMKALWDAQIELVSNYGITSLPIYRIPTDWIVGKSILFALALLFIAKWVDKTVTVRKPAAIIFSVLAFTSGFSSFIKANADLPLNNDLKVLIAPAITELNLNANVLAIYLTYWIPALLFCFVVAWKEKKSALHWSLAATVSALAFAFFNYYWPSQEAFLRASNLLNPVGVLFGAFLIYLIILAVRRIEARDFLDEHKVQTEQQGASDSTKEDKQTPSVSNKEIHALALLLFLFVVWHSREVLPQCTLIERQTPVLGRNQPMPQRWGKNLQSNPALKHAFFNIKHRNGFLSTVVWSVRPTPAGGNAAVLKSLNEDSAKSPAIANLDIYHMENWSKYYAGATAIFFNMDLVTPKMNIPRTGVTVMLPRVDGMTEILSFIGEPNQFQRFEWEAVRMVKAAAHAPSAGKRPNIVELTKMVGKL